MLPKRFGDIEAVDILRLLDLRIAEHKTLEYKERLPTGNSEECCEFLSDISSFANASGGDIIFGIADERDGTGKARGVPGGVKPLLFDSPATTIARIEQMIESGIQPRIPMLQVKLVKSQS